MKTMEEMILEKIESIKEVLSVSFVSLVESGQIGVEIALPHTDMFEEWSEGTTYKVGQIRKYKDILYKIAQDHTSQADILPPDDATLYEPIVINNLTDDNLSGQELYIN